MSSTSLVDFTLEYNTNYAIFLDNTRIDHLVTSWSTQISVDGGIGHATFETIYVPDLFRKRSSKIQFSAKDISIYNTDELEEGVENMTCLRIFVKNEFTGKYRCVFDGEIRSKSKMQSGNEYRMSFSADDYINWFTRTIVPIAVPTSERLTFPDRLRWKAQGIDLSNVRSVNQYRELNFRGLNIQEMWKKVATDTILANRIYAESEVAKFDNPLGRVVHMADIDPRFTKERSAMDFIVTSSATSISSIYVLMNDFIKSVIMEFYQSGDGVIRIKAPFWTEPVLKDHVIDSNFIINFSETTNWDSEYSRVIATGGLEWYEDDYSDSTKSILAPTVVYRNDGTFSTSDTMVTKSSLPSNLISSNKKTNVLTNDLIIKEAMKQFNTLHGNTEIVEVKNSVVSTTPKITTSNLTTQIYDNEHTSVDGVGEISAIHTGTWLDEWAKKVVTLPDGTKRTCTYGPGYHYMRSSYGLHSGIDWGMPEGTYINHIGSRGEVIVAGTTSSASAGIHVNVQITEGDYAGYIISYCHMSKVNVKVGDIVVNGSILGWSGNTGTSTAPHLHIGVYKGDPKSGSINPAYYLRYAGGMSYKNGVADINDSYRSLADDGTIAGVYDGINVGADELLSPTDYESKYGPSIYNVTQGMIKFSTSGSEKPNRSNMFQMLTSYSEFMLKYLNSTVNTASLQCASMPWLQPGFNIWIDPVGIDRVYYVSTISHQGSADGVYTSLGLTMGRTIKDFVENVSVVSSLHPKQSPNVFINQLTKGYIPSDGDFGKIVGTKKADYDTLRNLMVRYHARVGSTEPTYLLPKTSAFYKYLYGKHSSNSYIGNITAIKSNPLNALRSSGSSASLTSVQGINPSTWDTLSLGSSGNNVKQLQKCLIYFGYDCGKKGADGVFGTGTESAVKKFQKENDIKATGIVYNLTKSAIAKKIGTKSSILSNCTSTLRFGSTGSYVKELQILLTEKGFKCNATNGVFEESTELAVKKFQKKNGLNANGIVENKTKATLLR